MLILAFEVINQPSPLVYTIFIALFFPFLAHYAAQYYSFSTTYLLSFSEGQICISILLNAMLWSIFLSILCVWITILILTCSYKNLSRVQYGSKIFSNKKIKRDFFQFVADEFEFWFLNVKCLCKNLSNSRLRVWKYI